MTDHNSIRELNKWTISFIYCYDQDQTLMRVDFRLLEWYDLSHESCQVSRGIYADSLVCVPMMEDLQKCEKLSCPKMMNEDEWKCITSWILMANTHQWNIEEQAEMMNNPLGPAPAFNQSPRTFLKWEICVKY